MEKKELLSEIIGRLREHCGTELSQNSPLGDCFQDKVQETCFYTQVELTYGLGEITRDVSESFQTIGDLVDYILEQQN